MCHAQQHRDQCLGLDGAERKQLSHTREERVKLYWAGGHGAAEEPRCEQEQVGLAVTLRTCLLGISSKIEEGFGLPRVCGRGQQKHFYYSVQGQSHLRCHLDVMGIS